MEKLMKILITLAMLLILSSSASVQLNLTCQRCPASCGSSYCYRAKSTGYDNYACVNTDCDPSFKLSFYAYQCSTSTCPVGVCLSKVNSSMCLQNTTSCSNPTWIKFACGNCAATLGCDRCSIITSSYSNAAQRSCNSSCTSNAQFITTLTQCSKIPQQSGSTCPCCTSITGYEYLLGECSSQSEFYTAFELYKLFQNSSNSNSSTNTTDTTNSSNTQIRTKGQTYYLMIKFFVLASLLMIVL